MVPWAIQERFLDTLRKHYRAIGADPDLVETTTWAETGAPQEHAGFGRFSNDAKNLQTEFFTRHLRAHPLIEPIEPGPAT